MQNKETLNKINRSQLTNHLIVHLINVFNVKYCNLKSVIVISFGAGLFCF